MTHPRAGVPPPSLASGTHARSQLLPLPRPQSAALARGGVAPRAGRWPALPIGSRGGARVGGLSNRLVAGGAAGRSGREQVGGRQGLFRVRRSPRGPRPSEGPGARPGQARPAQLRAVPCRAGEGVSRRGPAQAGPCPAAPRGSRTGLPEASGGLEPWQCAVPAPEAGLGSARLGGSAQAGRDWPRSRLGVWRCLRPARGPCAAAAAPEVGSEGGAALCAARPSRAARRRPLERAGPGCLLGKKVRRWGPGG